MHSKTNPKQRVINGRLADALATLRHGELIFIADAGMVMSPTSIAPLPPEVELLDLGIVTGVPSNGQLLPALRDTGDIERVIVAERPADALLRVAGHNPASLIVVGNRGLGAEEGEVLGSVPAEIVRKAVCDVLVVQTSALDEDRLFNSEPAQDAAEGSHRIAGADPGARPAH